MPEAQSPTIQAPVAGPSPARLLEQAGALWREARWADRLLFGALGVLFAVRATFRGPHPDRLGFLAIGQGVLEGRLYRNAVINTYPPSFSVAMAPLAWLESHLGDLPVRLLWGGGQLAALAAFTFLSARALRLRLSLRAVALAWLCCWRYIVGDLNNQNVTLFLLAILAWALAEFVRGREARAGLLIATGAALKVFPGFAVIGLWRGERRARLVAGCALGALGALGFTAAVLGSARLIEAVRFWFEEVLPAAGGPQLLNQSLKGLLLRMAPGGRTAMAASGIGAAALLSLALVFALRPARDRRGAALDALLATLLSVMLLPFAWFHYYTAGMPICLAVFSSWGDLPPRPRSRALALIVAGSAIGAFLDIDLVGRAAWTTAATFGNALFGALLVFAAGFVLREAWRRPSDAEGENPA